MMIPASVTLGAGGLWEAVHGVHSVATDSTTTSGPVPAGIGGILFGVGAILSALALFRQGRQTKATKDVSVQAAERADVASKEAGRAHIRADEAAKVGDRIAEAARQNGATLLDLVTQLEEAKQDRVDQNEALHEEIKSLREDLLYAVKEIGRAYDDAREARHERDILLASGARPAKRSTTTPAKRAQTGARKPEKATTKKVAKAPRRR